VHRYLSLFIHTTKGQKMIETFILGMTVGIIVGAMLGLVFGKIQRLNALQETVNRIKFEVEVLSTEKNFYKDELEKQKKWDDFLPHTQAPELFNANLQKDEKGKFNPDDVPGVFDGVFGETK